MFPLFLTHMGPLIVISSLLCYQSYAATASAVSRPVGSIKIELLAETDTILAVPFLRYSEATLEVNSVTGVSNEQWTLGNLTVPPNFAPNDKFAASYFAQFDDGPMAGKFYTIIASGSSSISVDPAGDSLSISELIGYRIKIYPYWTIGTLFDSLKSFYPTTNSLGIATTLEILVFDVQPGVNPSATRSYFYFIDGANVSGGDGWRTKGGNSTLAYADDQIDQTSYVAIRNKSVDEATLVISGEVSTTPYVTPLLRLNETAAQDNTVGLVTPIPVSLSESGLYESGAFVPTGTFIGGSGDRLFVFNPLDTGFNKAASEAYFYYEGSDFPDGWKKLGQDLNADFGGTKVFRPGQGFLIRKAENGAISEDTWIYNRFYENDY